MLTIKAITLFAAAMLLSASTSPTLRGADECATINTAIGALGSTGGKVSVSAGSYTVSSTCVINKNNVEIAFDDGAFLQLAGSSSFCPSDWSTCGGGGLHGYFMFEVNGNNVYIHGGTIDGNCVNTPSTHCTREQQL